MNEEQSSESATVCPLCSVGCRLESDPDADRARGVSGAANPNGRLCRKGVDAFDIGDDGQRFTRPLIRQDGTTTPVSWEAAYEHVADAFDGIRERHGADSLAFFGAPYCTNEENYLLQKLARTLGTNNVDNRARLCHRSTARTLFDRLGRPATTNRLDGLVDADVVLVAGANPARRQPVAFNSFVRPAVNDGTTLVHLDPVGNRTTRLADVHLAPRPGTDALAFDLLSASVRDAGGIDREFVERRTSGYDAFETGLEGIDREFALSVTGLDADAVSHVAELVADADRVAALVGTGIESPGEELNASSALLNLLLSTGNLCRSGTGLFLLRGLVNEQGATDVGCVPDLLPGHRSVTDAEARSRIAAEWETPLPSAPGRAAPGLLAGFGDDIRGALVVGENPAISKHDERWIRRRLNALETLVVVDIRPNRTTEHADVILPAAAGVEKAGTVTNLDRRVQRFRPTTAPPGRARPDFDILRDLGRRLTERPDQFGYADVSEAFEELARVVPAYRGASYAAIGDGGHRWPFHGDDVLYRETFDTPDGTADFGSAQPMVDPTPDGELSLVAVGRTTEFYGDQEATDRTLRMHPADATALDIDPDDPVVVSTDGASVDAVAHVDEGVRRGTVRLHAEFADPLLRCSTSTVTVNAK